MSYFFAFFPVGIRFVLKKRLIMLTDHHNFSSFVCFLRLKLLAEYLKSNMCWPTRWRIQSNVIDVTYSMLTA